jgi:uncharacterized protein with HEPN domain
MMGQDQKFLFDILQAIELIESFVPENMTFSEYLTDKKTQSAIERQLSIIGEAINKFDKAFPDNAIENARQIVGLRNRIIHTYDAIDSSIIWTIIRKHISVLKAEIKLKMN